MAKTARTVALATGLAILGLAATTPKAFGDERVDSAIRILVITKMGVPPRETLLQAQAETARIYAAAGVRLIWTNPDPSLPRLTVLIVSHPNFRINADAADAMGAAPAAGQGMGRLAYAFYDRIEALARQHCTDVAKILGNVMAHELGHILLARAMHSDEGIMRSRWGKFEMDLAAAGSLMFTNEEARSIRSAVADMNADHQRGRTNEPTNQRTNEPTNLRTYELTNLQNKFRVFANRPRARLRRPMTVFAPVSRLSEQRGNEMATRAWRHTAFITVMALSSVGTQASAEPQDARVTLKIRNDAQVPGVLLAEAKAHVEAIYAKAGIGVTFINAAADLFIVLLSHRKADKMRQIPDVLGFAPSVLGRIAYILQPRVDRLADSYRTSRAFVLGVAMAHEMGHLLMPDAHSTTGIMRPEWDPADFRQAGHDNLLFTQAQAAEMCARLTSRLATSTIRPN